MIASAPWDARTYHTTVIDAAGAIYVIGGFNGRTHYKDVWVSTDGGAYRTRGVLDGCLRVLEGLLRGYLWGTQRYSRGIEGVLSGYLGTT